MDPRLQEILSSIEMCITTTKLMEQAMDKNTSIQQLRVNTSIHQLRVNENLYNYVIPLMNCMYLFSTSLQYSVILALQGWYPPLWPSDQEHWFNPEVLGSNPSQGKKILTKHFHSIQFHKNDFFLFSVNAEASLPLYFPHGTPVAIC